MIELTEIGYVQKVYGYKGELKVSIEEMFEIELVPGKTFLFLEILGSRVPYCIESIHPLGEEYRIKFRYIDDPESAAEYANTPVFIESNKIPKEIVDTRFEGISNYVLLDSKKKKIGTISRVEEYPQQLMAIIEDTSGKTHLIPLVEQWILSLDHTDKILIMELPEGLIE